MDKLKYIKIQNEDGSYSGVIPVGADAANIDLANGKTLEEKITEIDNALSSGATVPTKLSAFENDMGFITNSVANLSNYYNKSNSYSKTEINNLINNISTLNISIVSKLPTSNISTSTIYLVSAGTSGDSIYNEYIYVNSKWELIGTTAVDLTNYYTKTEVNNLINSAVGNALGGSY